ncbi:hypothetical protein C5167_014861 [Papaver somniferum]|uniref:DUF4216 domain-containing protein n=1 Tax=Papaver somniferum TaxID=3469 RepID=A0A4Y7J6D3_PAPSO|nr:hypothetical protein C5167_014861 [Papaver somniferum]
MLKLIDMQQLDLLNWIQIQVPNEKKHIPWLRGQLEGTPMTDFHMLAIGTTFRTVSGVTMNACTSFRESSRDTNLVDDDTTYYDILKKILELDYGFARSSKEEDEPFIHASQVSQVFYCSDLTRKHWNLVLESPIRSDPHINAFEDPYVFTATSSDAPLISETVGDDDYWSVIAQGDDEYSDVDDQLLCMFVLCSSFVVMRVSEAFIIHVNYMPPLLDEADG